MRNGNLLKSRVSEIRVKRIRVNQGVGVLFLIEKNLRFWNFLTYAHLLSYFWWKFLMELFFQKFEFLFLEILNRFCKPTYSLFRKGFQGKESIFFEGMIPSKTSVKKTVTTGLKCHQLNSQSAVVFFEYIDFSSKILLFKAKLFLEAKFFVIIFTYLR